ncbi:ORF37 [Fowl aviadenovirus 2]|uniref:ORF37 n=1 Tax=Fowl aviadenovirus 2 TaxID=172859 RepID=A0A7G3VX81_9ADEN|nr:ORF37 [Fowl aviadenovirus 2]
MNDPAVTSHYRSRPLDGSRDRVIRALGRVVGVIYYRGRRNTDFRICEFLPKPDYGGNRKKAGVYVLSVVPRLSGRWRS